MVGPVALLVGVLAATTGAASAQQATPCGVAPEGYNVIVSDAALIEGTAGADFICAGDSANRILAGSGDDIVHAGAGANTVFGQGGNDRIDGGPDRDRIIGGGGADLVFGHGGRDLLRGGEGRDVLSGGSGRDRLLGQGGNDVLRGNGGRDVLTGGDGDDRADGGRSRDRCVDTLHVKRCDEVVGLISVVTGFNGEPGWSVLHGDRDFATSDDGRFVVFAGRPIGTTKILQVVVRDILEDRFTVVGQSRPLRRPRLCGLDISGDGSTVAFSSDHHRLFEDPDDVGGLRLFLVDLDSGDRTLVPKFSEDLELDFMCGPQLSSDASTVLYSLGVGVDEARNVSESRFIVRHELSQSPEVIDRHEVLADFQIWEERLSGDGSTVMFHSSDSTLPGEVNGRSLDVVVRREDGTSLLGFTESSTGRTTFWRSGLSQDGSVLAAGWKTRGTYRTSFGFQDLDEGTTLEFSASALCAGCRFNESVFENDWAAVGLVKLLGDRGTARAGVGLLAPDGRTDIILEDSNFVGTVHHVTPDGRVVGLWPWTEDPYQLYFRDPATL